MAAVSLERAFFCPRSDDKATRWCVEPVDEVEEAAPVAMDEPCANTILKIGLSAIAARLDGYDEVVIDVDYVGLHEPPRCLSTS